MIKRTRKHGSITDRFNHYVMPEPNTGCWIWTGTISDSGYGTLRLDNMNKKAHRLSYEMHKGTIPVGLLVCHTCDTKICVNPDHLFVGTDKDNVRDMMMKGRSKFPCKFSCRNNPISRFTLLDFQIMDDARKHGFTLSSIASYFGIGITYVVKITKFGYRPKSLLKLKL